MWVKVPDTETKGRTIAPLYKDRFVPRMLMGGDSTILILKIKEQTPQADDSQTTATHKKSEPEEKDTPSKGHSYLDLVNRSDDGIKESSVSSKTSKGWQKRDTGCRDLGV